MDHWQCWRRTSHFLFPLFHWQLRIRITIHRYALGHFCFFAPRLSLRRLLYEQEFFVVTYGWPARTRRASAPTNQVNNYELLGLIYFLLICLELEGSFRRLQPQPASVQNDGYIGRCVPRSIPDSQAIWGQTSFVTGTIFDAVQVSAKFPHLVQ